MNWKAFLGYIITTIAAPLAGYFAGKHTTPELGGVVAGGVAGAGSRILQMVDPPKPAEPK